MKNNKINLLSTKMISDSLVGVAELYNISIDRASFIETEEITGPSLKDRIAELSGENITVIFTSANAVRAVNKLLETRPSWKIFCIEPATKKSVADAFGEETIIGTAENAAHLAEKIIEYPSIKKLVFFCGDQRRNVLHEKLKEKGIVLEEVVVYKTVERARIVSNNYDGILFFSPSAVRSFFSVNSIPDKTEIFVIGSTTADEVKLFSDLPVIIAAYPDAQQLIGEAIKHFSTSKTFPCRN